MRVMTNYASFLVALKEEDLEEKEAEEYARDISLCYGGKMHLCINKIEKGMFEFEKSRQAWTKVLVSVVIHITISCCCLLLLLLRKGKSSDAAV